MKCFVASAFGKDDVDEVYEKSVLPVMRRLSISPSRVDRVEHNDNIDMKILDLISQSDLAVVDLTYARPSVYYEAGFASGLGKPVVYTVRKDHFKNLDDSLRVHFDLQMKNIIQWSTGDATFSKRLEKRLMYVTRPLRAAAARADEQNQEREAFAMLSQRDKLSRLVTKAQSILSSRGFGDLEMAERPRSRYSFSVTKYTSTTRLEFQVVCATSLGLDFFRNTSSLTIPLSYGPSQYAIENTEVHLVLVTTESIPLSRRKALQDLETLPDGSMHWRTSTGPNDKFYSDVLVHFIDKVCSEEDLADRLKPLISSVGLVGAARSK